MKFKKLFLLPITLCLVTGCDNYDLNYKDEHTHTFSDVYVYDRTNHWHPATCGHEVKFETERHTFVDEVVEPTYETSGYTVHKCSVCGYSYIDSETDILVHYHTVTWLNEDGSVIYTDSEVEEGTTPIYDKDLPTKEGDEFYSYVFDGWMEEPSPIFEDTTYTATFKKEIRKYVVSFVNDDNTVLQTEELTYGEEPVYKGEEPIKENDAVGSYKFDKWTPEIVKVSGDATYKATYIDVKNKYRITWKNENGDTLYHEDVSYGEMPSFVGDTPTKDGDEKHSYTFDGWTPEVKEVTGNATYTAKFKETIKQFTISWLNDDGSLIKTENYDYGDIPSFNGVPTKESDAQFSYTFNKWKPSIAQVTKDASYKASYTGSLNTYTVTWIDSDGSVLEVDESMKYGEYPEFNKTYKEFPRYKYDALYKYSFVGWSPEVSEVTGDITYQAVFNSKEIYSFELVEGGNAYIVSDCNDYDSKTLYLPSEYNGLPVIGIKQKAIHGVFDEDSPEVETLVIPDTYTHFEKGAFLQLRCLKHVTLPNTLTEIPEEMFAECGSLETVNIPEGVTSIGKHAFSGCYSLTQINLPSTLETINYGAFYDCWSLESIDLPSSLQSIGEYAFYQCEKLSSISLPNSIESIESFTFARCHGLTSIKFPANLKTIKSNAFSFCLFTGELVLPEGLISLEDDAFSDNVHLVKITLPASLLTIGKYAFERCTSLITLVNLSSIELSIGTSNGNNLYSRTIEEVFTVPTESSLVSLKNDYYIYNNNEVLCYIGSKTDIDDIPSTVNKLRAYSFYGLNSLESIIIPGNIKVIGDHAFADNQTLTSVVLENGVESIGESAFINCRYLSFFDMPDTVTEIGESAFSGCWRLEYIYLSTSLASIQDYTFYDCRSLKYIVIPLSVTVIKKLAFSNSNSSLIFYVEAETAPSGFELGWNYVYSANETYYGYKWAD